MIKIIPSIASTSESELSVSVGHCVALIIDIKRFFEIPINSSKQYSRSVSCDLS